MGTDENCARMLGALQLASRSGRVTRNGLSVLIELVNASAASIVNEWARLDIPALADRANMPLDSARKAIRALNTAGILDIQIARVGRGREVRLTQPARERNERNT